MIYGLAFRAWDDARMVAYTVHEKPEPAIDRIDRAEELVFIKEGFVWSAAFFAPFWMVANGMWLTFCAYLAAVVGLSYGLTFLGFGEQEITFAILALHVLVGFEAVTLKRWTLEQYGWDTIGTVTGRNISECERRFFDEWLPSQPVLRPGDGSGLPQNSASTPSAPNDGAASPVTRSQPVVPGKTETVKRGWSWPTRGQKA